MEKMNNKSSSYSVPAVEAMLNVVEYMSEHCDALGVSELARNTGISVNLAFRIMKKLLERGYVQSNESMAYQLTAKWMSLGALIANNFNMFKLAHTHLADMCAQLGFTAMLQTLERGEMLVRDTVAPFKPVFLQIAPGSKFPAKGNAYAKAVLAFSKGTEKYNQAMKKIRASENFNQKEFDDELEKVVQTKIAYDWGDYNKGIFCIASPVFSASDQPEGAIGITGLIDNKDQILKLADTVRIRAERISSEIGHKTKK